MRLLQLHLDCVDCLRLLFDDRLVLFAFFLERCREICFTLQDFVVFLQNLLDVSPILVKLYVPLDRLQFIVFLFQLLLQNL